MATFSYNPFSSKSSSEQYFTHLQTQRYVNQPDISIRDSANMIAAVAKIQGEEIEDAIRTSSEAQKDAILKAKNEICSSIEGGFSQLNLQMNSLSNIVGHGFSIMIESQKIANKYLGKIEQLLHIPDTQKQRAYHIEEGMKFLQYAFSQPADTEFYNLALEEFKKAEAIEPKDFFSLYHIGFIYLKSIKHIDVQLAEQYFRKAANFYLAEAYVAGTTFTNNMLTKQDLLLEAAEAYLYASEACYIQQKKSEAIELATKAWETAPAFSKAGFLLSKYLAADNKVQESVEALEEAINKNPLLAIEVIPDRDLTSKPEILELLGTLKEKAVKEARKRSISCHTLMNPESVVAPYLAEIDERIQRDTYLDAIKAQEMFSQIKEWRLPSNVRYTDTILGCIQEENRLAKAEWESFENKEREAKQHVEREEKMKEELEAVIADIEAKRNVIVDEIAVMQAWLDSKQKVGVRIIGSLAVIFLIGAGLTGAKEDAAAKIVVSVFLVGLVVLFVHVASISTTHKKYKEEVAAKKVELAAIDKEIAIVINSK